MNKFHDESQGWKTVKKGPKLQTNDTLQSTKVSTHNRFEKLSESESEIETNITHNCPKCDNTFISKGMLEKHMKNYHEISELEQEKKKREETRRALDSLRTEYNGCRKELMIFQEEN